METKAIPSGKIQVRPLTIGELSRIYEVDRRTLYNWIKPFAEEIGERRGRFYSIPQVLLIIEKLGIPHTVEAS
jgi:transposase-like protein